MKHNKLKSVKVLVVIWSIALITYIVIAGKTDFLSLASLLATIPLAYLPVNAYQKKLYIEKDENKDGE